MDNNELLTTAMEYAAAGFRVFPLKPGGKKPITANGFKNATTDAEQLRRWWTSHPAANIGIACGAASGHNLTVVDLDIKPGKNGLRELFDWQKEHGELPKTLTVKTGGGGYHYYYFTDKPYKNGTDILGAGSGIDVRDAGGYVVAPPSVHESGSRYEWADGFDVSRIADGGEVLEKLLTERETSTAAPSRVAPVASNSGLSDIKPISGGITDRITAKLGLNFSEGGRNDSIHRLAASLQARGYEDGAILELCERVNSERCTPPLPEKEVQTAVASALKSIGKGTPRTVDAVADFAQYSVRLADKFPFIIPHEKKDGTIYYTVSAPILADYMLKNDRFLFLDTGGEKPPALWYSDGVYKPLDANRFKDKIKSHIAEFDRFDETLHSSRVYDEVYKQILISAPRVKSDELNQEQHLINFKNGLLDIHSMKLLPHSSGIYSTIQIPCAWSGTSPGCSVFDAFLDTLINGDGELLQLLWEYIGLVISNIHGYRPKRALFLVGEGNTGKSQFLKLLARLIGSENYAATDLSGIEEKFGTFTLWGKRLAGSPDTSFMKIKELSSFKNLSGGDPVDFEQKGKDKFTGMFTGCFVFCCNRMPKFSGDRGDHVYERMAIVRCPNIIPEERRDPFLLDKMFEEREGIIYKAVTALRAFTSRGCKFELPQACKAELAQYKVENDDVLQFLEECTCPREQCDSGIFTTAGAMYTAYKEWARQSGTHYTASRSEFKDAARAMYGDNIEIRTKNARGYTFELTQAAREELGGFFNYAE